MKSITLISLLVTLLVFLMPVAAVREAPLVGRVETQNNEVGEAAVTNVTSELGANNPDTTTSTEIIVKTDVETLLENHSNAEKTVSVTKVSDEDVMIRVETENGIETIPMDQYLLGVLAAEMPAYFPIEALKAQAVAARTFTYSRMQAAREGKGTHKNADVCTDAAHCKGYIPWEEITAEWKRLGLNSYADKVAEAVESTDGEVLFYGGEPIVAVFHAASGAYTENAKDVWGSDVPYLRSVESPDGAEYVKKESFSTAEFKRLFLKRYPSAELDGAPASWFTDQVTSEAGGVISVRIGGVEVSGKTVRSIYSLASANFKVVVAKNKVSFMSSGFGHCVGMSQYGARALALEGKNYEEILAWYYTGVVIKKMDQNLA